MYIKRKPCIYEIKFFLLHEVESGYVHNTEIQAHTPINEEHMPALRANKQALSANEEQGAYCIYGYLIF